MVSNNGQLTYFVPQIISNCLPFIFTFITVFVIVLRFRNEKVFHHVFKDLKRSPENAIDFHHVTR